MLEFVTLESLAGDLALSVNEIMRLAAVAGVPALSPTQRLSSEERSRIYDTWLSSNVNININVNVNNKAAENRSTQIRENKELILIDTCSLLASGAEIFLKKSAPILKKANREIIVPLAVMQELEKFVKDTFEKVRAGNARRMLEVIKAYVEMGVMAVYGDNNDGSFADNVFLKATVMFARQYRIKAITQDHNLAQDLLALNDFKSVNYKLIKVCKISSNGNLLLVLRDKPEGRKKNKTQDQIISLI